MQFRQIFKETQITFKTTKYARRWLGGPNMSFWPQQLNFALWCATTGCGISRKFLLDDSNDSRLPEATRGIVYQIKCKDCDCVYIGQTSRALKSRVEQHAKAIATLDKNSLLAKHHMLHSHHIDLTSVEIVDRSSTWRQRLILEAWHSMRNTNAINEHIALPNVYNNIKNL